ncbi:MAG TPA: GNAT family N-acetyltransferase [Actinomycetota bacterium]
MTDLPAAPTIRTATVEDARAIAEIHVASWRWAYRGEMSEAFLKDLDVDAREIRWRGTIQEAGTTVLVGGVDDIDRVGFSCVGPSRDDDAREGDGELHAIYLLQEATGVGLGRALLEGANSILRDSGYRRATAWVLESNVRARTFYERARWTWDGSRSEHRFDCANLPIVRYVFDL